MGTQRRTMYAEMNLGTALRHSGEYATALEHYGACLKLARAGKDEEVLCGVLQHLGINSCIQGRLVRQSGDDLIRACKYQSEAFDFLLEALTLAKAADWETALADGLSRLARVYEEIYQLEADISALPHQDNKLLSTFQALIEKARYFRPPSDVEREDELIFRGKFVDLSVLEQAARLYELSVLLADLANNLHRTLDSLMQFARLLLALKQYDLVRNAVSRVERLKVEDHQGELFATMADITLADLDFDIGKREAALKAYSTLYAQAAKQSGYALYLLADRTRDLERRLRSLSASQAVLWCDVLQRSWRSLSVSKQRPEMISLLERIRIDALSGKWHKE